MTSPTVLLCQGTEAVSGQLLPVVHQWFERTILDEGIYRLSEPHLDVFLRSNIWYVRGRDRDLLVDTGNGIGSLRRELASLAGGRPIVAVATHGHSDHIGGLHEFAIRVAHRLEGSALDQELDSPALVAAKFGDEYVSDMRALGYDLPDLLMTAVPYAGFDPNTFVLEPAPATWLVEEGDLIDLGNRFFQVLHMPGHTPGSIGLWEERTGILFSGDTVFRDQPLMDALPGSSVSDYVRSMRRLQDLPVRIVHGGHDPSFGRDRLVERIEEYLRIRDSIQG
jgi:glyoxylase-like metal-dependent hydrolase (beta-lactamase superfamily II)